MTPIQIILSLIGSANTLVKLAESIRESAKRTGEWTNAEEAAFEQSKALAWSRPAMQVDPDPAP